MKEKAVIFWAHQGLEFFHTQEGELFISPQQYEIIALCPPGKEKRLKPEVCREFYVLDDLTDMVTLTPIVADICKRFKDVRLIGMQEDDVLPMAYLRREFGIVGLLPEVANRFRNKVLMKQVVGPMAPMPAYVAVTDMADLLSLLDTYGSIIVKPIDGTASVDTHHLSSITAVQAFVAERQGRLHEYVAEEYIGGERYHCDSLIYEGEILFTGICQVDDSLRSVRELQPLTSLVCHDFDRPLLQKMLTINSQVIKNLGLKTGCTHCEFLIPNADTVLFGEICARPGGGVSKLYYEAYGINLTHQWVRMEVGEAPDVMPSRHQYVGFTSFFSPTGILRKITDLEELDLDWITWHRMLVKEIGDKVELPGLDYGVIGSILFVAPTVTLLHERLNYLLSTFQFEIDRSYTTHANKVFSG